MNTSNLINNLCKEKGISFAELACRIGQTPQNFNKKLKRETVSTEEQTIRMPFSQSELKRGNYITVGNKLQELGFTQIYKRKIEDLIKGWITKDGLVESVLVDGNENKPIEKNVLYDYDQKFVICYHTKK